MTFTLGSSFPVDVTVTALNPMLPVSFEPPVAAPSLARGRGTRLRHRILGVKITPELPTPWSMSGFFPESFWTARGLPYPFPHSTSLEPETKP